VASRRRRCPALRSSCSLRECSRPRRRCSVRDTQPSPRGPCLNGGPTTPDPGDGVPRGEFLDTHYPDEESSWTPTIRTEFLEAGESSWTPTIRGILGESSWTPSIRGIPEFLDTHYPGGILDTHSGKTKFLDIHHPQRRGRNSWTPIIPGKILDTHQPAATPKRKVRVPPAR
jgi:hypothetical protein